MWKNLRERQKGQSLVELALALPILLVLFLGLIELGFALRAYLVLTNVNREAARFVGRGTFTPQQVFNQTMVSFGKQLQARPAGQSNPNVEIIITYINIPAFKDTAAEYDGTTYSITTTGSLTMPSKVDIDLELPALSAQHHAQNDELVAAHDDAVRSPHHLAIVEIYYYHKQVLADAPVISWVFPDTMVLYTRTMTRIGGSRN